MAIPLGTNDLKIYRRHASYCTRYPALKNKPDTYRPVSKKDQKLDTCQCPIWCRGYLAKETKIVKGKRRSKRVFASLDTSDWTAGEQVVARLYERGSLPSIESALRTIDTSAITVRHATERYLQSRRDGSLNPIEQDTYNHYASLLNMRLVPFCDERAIVYIRDFENKDVCSQFTESWRQLRPDVKLISKWLGHESVAVTLEHYGNWIKETRRLAEDVSRDANAKMKAKIAALRNQTFIDRTNPSALPRTLEKV